MSQKTHQLFRPVRLCLANLSALESELRQNALQRVCREVDDLVLQRFNGRQRQQLALVNDAGHFDICIDHRLSQQQRAPSGFSRGAKFLAHVGDCLLVSRCGLGTGRTGLHRRCRTDRAAS
ncbi:MAG: hypothetical protein Q8S92_02400 [Hydrogenophaga sp.]|uniref:hypothetical protein n=1 Tax=Hydrogenophaga sp. TaxID=1904254 RepID=UPI002735583A|nr:hypothetical protein [Hydrogenophaga sp.]MDP3347829.1 hypothetical protein [Hydrogenophaga sp.]